MRPTVKIKMESNRLPMVRSKSMRKLALGVAKIAADVTSGAQADAPVDKGILKGSIQPTQLSEYEWAVDVGAEHGAYVEFGTGARGEGSQFEGKSDEVEYTTEKAGMPAQPYLTPNVERQREPFNRMIEQAVRESAQ